MKKSATFLLAAAAFAQTAGTGFENFSVSLNYTPAVTIMGTDGGGLKILNGYYYSTDVIVEVLPDGKIKGDPVRALRLLAASVHEQSRRTIEEAERYRSHVPLAQQLPE